MSTDNQNGSRDGVTAKGEVESKEVWAFWVFFCFCFKIGEKIVSPYADGLSE